LIDGEITLSEPFVSGSSTPTIDTLLSQPEESATDGVSVHPGVWPGSRTSCSGNCAQAGGAASTSAARTGAANLGATLMG